MTSLITKHFANPAFCHVILELGQTQRKLMLANISLKCETVSLQCTAMSAAAVSLFWSCVPGVNLLHEVTTSFQDIDETKEINSTIY